MTKSPTTITCRGCGYAELPASQYDCPHCKKPNLKAVIPAAMEGGRWIWVIGGGAFGLLAVLTLVQWIDRLAH
jgi:hypothetical protein